MSDQQPQMGQASGQEPKQPSSQNEERFDAEYVKSLRAEAAQYRTKLRELEGRVQKDEEAKLSEQEKLQKRLQTLEKEGADKTKALQERIAEYEVKLAASKLGIVDPDAAWRLLDQSSLEFDESGKPKDIEKALKTLLTNKPYLGAGAGFSSAASPAGGTSKDITSSDPMIIAARKAAGLPG